jgi:hypothetical protein
MAKTETGKRRLEEYEQQSNKAMVEYSNPDQPRQVPQEVERVPLQPSERTLLDGAREHDAPAPSGTAVARRTAVEGTSLGPLLGVSGGLALPTVEASRAEAPSRSDVRHIP